MPHFKEFVDPNFLCNIDFLNDRGQYERKVLTITEVKKSQVHDGKSKKSEPETVAALCFKECKPLILSSRNLKTLIKMTRKVNTDDWRGIRIELHILENQKAFGQMWDVVRITPQLPAPSKPIDYSAQNASLRACTTLAELQAVYTALTADEKAGTLKVKDEMKQKLA